jgi:hypothetical protein
MLFTRYLYLKDEVEIALMLSLLNKKEEESLFWAYELYYSGFIDDLIQLIFKIYYDLYACLNPSFEAFLIKKVREIREPLDFKKNIAIIINNLLIRPINMDVFLLRLNSNLNIITEEKLYIKNQTNQNNKNTFLELLNREKYENISQFIFKESEKTINYIEIINIVVDYFNSKGLKLNKEKIWKEFNITIMTYQNIPHILTAKIMHYYNALKMGKMGKSIYIMVEDEELKDYETKNVDPPRKLLPIVTKYSTNDYNNLHLFKLERYKYNIKNDYYYNWLYYASFSPLWKYRIEKYGGTFDDDKKTVVFKDDDSMELFYENYGYEPDEQKKEIQEKNIPELKNDVTWQNFIEKYKKFEGLYKIEEDTVLFLKKMEY